MNAERERETHTRSRAFTVALAKLLMKLRESPPPTPQDFGLNEIFRHESYVEARPDEQRKLRARSSLFRYDDELLKPFFQTYFESYRTDSGSDFRSHLTGKTVLDFGCFTGGRGVRWAEQYGIKRVCGTDINPIYIKAAGEFAHSKGLPHDYRLLGGDNKLPFDDQSIDTIVSFDVFEHVNDLPEAMRECLRVLKPGGVVFAVFPSYYQPLESHLDLVTRTPALQWIFDGQTLTRAYFEILSERPAQWYKPQQSTSGWEKLPTLNGVTVRMFHRLLDKLPFSVEHVTRTPILTTGKTYNTLRKYFLRPVLGAALRTRFVDDYILDRIAVVLRKPAGNHGSDQGGRGLLSQVR